MIRELLRSQKQRIFPLIDRGQLICLRSAMREQRLDDLIAGLRAIAPDVSAQNTTYSIDTPALELRVRGLHAFQIRMTLDAFERILKDRARTDRAFTIADIGDSAGTHLLYLNTLLGKDKRLESGFRSLSVNLDPVAVEKIRAKGLEAVLCPAEKLHEKDIRADLFLSFETIEHLRDPISFLDAMSRESRCEWFTLTVPYVRASRVGMQYIRNAQRHPTTPENTHVFELCPEDWRLIFLHAGWSIQDERVYLQYPRRSPLRLLGPLWRKYDFEGFYGVLLRRDRTWADLYQNGI